MGLWSAAFWLQGAFFAVCSMSNGQWGSSMLYTVSCAVHHFCFRWWTAIARERGGDGEGK